MTRDADQVFQILRQCIEQARSVEIDGLGVFRRRAEGYEFCPARGPKIFIAYVQEDGGPADRLYAAFRDAGFDPWLDRKKLLPGQNWARAIRQAIEVSDFFVACLSPRAIRKRGQFQAELKYAIDCAARIPLDRIYFIPIRLEECVVPACISREFQYVDLFPEWEPGIRRVISVISRCGAGAR